MLFLLTASTTSIIPIRASTPEPASKLGSAASPAALPSPLSTSRCNDVTQNETWTAAGSPYLLTCTINVAAGVQLTIDPGVVVKAGPGNMGLNVFGSLVVNGTQASPVYFTSYRDDTGPAAGDWRGIYFGPASTQNLLSHVHVQYAGDSGFPCLYSDTADLTIAGSTIDDGNGAAIYLNGPASMGVSVLSTDATGNLVNGMVVAGTLTSSPITTYGTWLASSLPYVLQATLTVPDVLHLTIESGTVVKSAGVSVGLNVLGTLIANGTALSPVRFTSLHDDTVGNDTDGAGGPVQKGDWRGLYFGPASSGNQLGNVRIRYAGNSGSPCLYSDTAGLTVTASTIDDGNGPAIYLNGPASMGASVQGTTAAGNTINGMVVAGTLTSSSTAVSGTWLASSLPYVLQGTLTVPEVLHLTLNSGTVVKSVGVSVGLNVMGRLTANGTVASPIRFTSVHDDTDGVDTDGDGGDPQKGDWRGLYFGPASSGNQLGNVRIRYAGNSSFPCLYSDTAGLTVNASAIDDGNGPAIYLNGPASMGVSVQSTTATGNTVNGMLVAGTLTSSSTAVSGTWLRSSLPYVLQATLTVPAVLNLTLEPGTVVKSGPGYIGLDVYGTLTAIGNGPAPITFTSFPDDTVGGDTDGAGGGPLPGGWRGIYFAPGSAANVLNSVEVRYAGYFSFAALYTQTSGLTLNNCTLYRNQAVGLYVVGAGVSPVIVATRFIQNDTGISFANGAGGAVTQSVFVSHTTAGIAIDSNSQPDLGEGELNPNPLLRGFNSFACNLKHVCGTNTTSVFAQHNWWGSAPPNTSLFCTPATLLFTDYLSQETAPPGGSPAAVVGQVTVARAPLLEDLTLTWQDVAPTCAYDVYRNIRPDDPPEAPFVRISPSGGVSGNTFIDYLAAAAGTPDKYFYKVVVH